MKSSELSVGSFLPEEGLGYGLVLKRSSLTGSPPLVSHNEDLNSLNGEYTRHSLTPFYERAHRGACRHHARRNVRRVVSIDGRELVHIVDLMRAYVRGHGVGAGVWTLALVCGRGCGAWAWCMGALYCWGAWVWVWLTMMPPLSCMPRTVGLARQCSACNVAPLRRWKPATGSSAWRGLGLGLGMRGWVHYEASGLG